MKKKIFTRLSKIDEKIEDLKKAIEIHSPISPSSRGVSHYSNFKEAFLKMEETIETFIKDSKRRGIESPVIKLKLIAVAMTYSWEYFIQIAIPRLLNEHQKSKVNLEILFIAPDFLQNIPLANKDIDWVEKSKSRINDVQKFAKECEKYNGRLLFSAMTYSNLPHWHGWLINDDQLFLGRADWTFDDEHPTLRVGQNKYRYFDSSSSAGSERINLFSSWFIFYSRYASKMVCCYPK